MIEKALGVIPSRNELNEFTAKKTDEDKSKKTEFENYLEKGLNKENLSRGIKKKIDHSENEVKQSRFEAVKSKKQQEKKELKETKNERNIEKKKKKLNNDTNEMALTNMVSDESVDKVPSAEENLDNLEVASNIEIENTQTEPALSVNVRALDDSTHQADVQQNFMALEKDPQGQLEQPVLTDFSETVLEDKAAIQNTEIAQQMSEANPLQTDIFETLSKEDFSKKLESMLTATKEKSLATSFNDAKSVIENNDKASNDNSMNSATSDSDTNEENSLSQSHQPMNAHLSHLSESMHTGVTDFKNIIQDVQKPQDLNNSELSEDSNVQEILNQAKFLVKQGGGEVTVKMTPEGLGEIHLKVMLENGKMNVEMTTQDKQAKKLIETSLSDLKSSLASQQIHVEHVTLNDKINRVQDANTENRTQFSQSQQSFDQTPQRHFQQGSESSNSGSYLKWGAGSKPQEMQTVKEIQKVSQRAAGQKIYQSHKARSLDAVA